MNKNSLKENSTMKISIISCLIFLFLFDITCFSQETGNSVSSDTVSIYYRTYGKGKPLLIINGGPGMNSDGFEGLAKKLSKNNKTIIYDQRGTGKSVLKISDSSTVNMKLMIDDIESIRKKLKIQKWSVLGHSFGGMVASYYATLYPENISKIILSSSGGIDLDLLNYVPESINSKLSKAQSDSLNYWSKKISNGDTSHYAAYERGKILACAYVFNKKFIPVIGERLTQGNMTINQLIFNDLQKMNFDCSEKLKAFKNPVLIIQGKQDIIKAVTAEKAHKVLENSKIVYLDHCIHYGWLDNESVYFREINNFLSKEL